MICAIVGYLCLSLLLLLSKDHCLILILLQVKNFILIGDIHKSIYFLSWKEQGAQLNLLAKDFGSLDCFATEFLIDASTLSLVVSDAQKNIQVRVFSCSVVILSGSISDIIKFSDVKIYSKSLWKGLFHFISILRYIFCGRLLYQLYGSYVLYSYITSSSSFLYDC